MGTRRTSIGRTFDVTIECWISWNRMRWHSYIHLPRARACLDKERRQLHQRGKNTVHRRSCVPRDGHQMCLLLFINKGSNPPASTGTFSTKICSDKNISEREMIGSNLSKFSYSYECAGGTL